MKRSELLFSALTVPLDYLALLAAALVAYWFRYFPLVQEIRPVVFDLPFGDYIGISGAVIAIWILIFAIAGLYRMGGTTKMTVEVSRVFIAIAAGMAVVLAVMVFSRYLFDSRFILIAAWVFAIIFVTVERMVVRVIQRRAYQFGLGVHRVAIVGNGHIAHVLEEEFSKNPMLGFRTVKVFSQFDDQAYQELYRLAQEDKVDEVIHVNPNIAGEVTAKLIDLVNNFHLTYKYTADLLGTQLTNHEVKTIVGTPVIEVKRTRLDGWGRIAKRLFDILAGLVLFIIFSPIMFLAMLAIVLESGMPFMFSYKRIGQNGKPFTYFKFRSMVKNAHELRYDPSFAGTQENLRDGTPMIKYKDDPRITRVGKILRRFSIDELPELILVLMGKMSLVGPRPHEIEEVEKYQKHHKKLLTIKPGITGLAQVSGRSDLQFEEEVKLDSFYIENWSLGLDIQILLKTPWAVIRPRRTE